MLDTFLWSGKFPFIFPSIRELEIVAGVRSGEIADSCSGKTGLAKLLSELSFGLLAADFAHLTVERLTLARAVDPLVSIFWNQRLSGWFLLDL